MSSHQWRSFAEEPTPDLKQPLVRESEGTENAKVVGQPLVMEESVVGSLRRPAPHFVKDSAFQEETIEEKACSDPNLHDPKDHSFMFTSVGEGPNYRVGSFAGV